MRLFNFPIMVGLHEKADKCCMIVKDKKFGGYSLFIARLKEPMEYGIEVPKENIGKVLCHIHFGRLEALKAHQKAVNKIVEMWESEESK